MARKSFDPYHKWLGIAGKHRPPTHYELLGLSAGESDAELIEAAALRQTAKVRRFQAGKHAESAAQLLEEIAAAQICLADKTKRAEYDACLQKRHMESRPRAAARGAVPSAPQLFDALLAGDSMEAAPLVPSLGYLPSRRPAARSHRWALPAAVGAGSVLAMLVVLLRLSGRSVDSPPPPPPPPTVTIVGWQPLEPVAGGSVTFTVECANPENGRLTIQYETSLEANRRRPVEDGRFTVDGLRPGPLTVSVIATDREENQSLLESRTVEVKPAETEPLTSPNESPTVTIVGWEPPEPVAGGSVTFTVECTDPENDALTIEYETNLEADRWRSIEGGRFTVENLPSGPLTVFVAVFDDKGLLLSRLEEQTVNVKVRQVPALPSVASAPRPAVGAPQPATPKMEFGPEQRGIKSGMHGGDLWLMTTTPPGDDWKKLDFDTSKASHRWVEKRSPFGTYRKKGDPYTVYDLSGRPLNAKMTDWISPEIWLRKEVNVPPSIGEAQVRWVFVRDDDLEVYVNGELEFRREGWNPRYQEEVKSPRESRLKPGKNLVAVHCKDHSRRPVRWGGSVVDVGLSWCLPLQAPAKAQEAE